MLDYAALRAVAAVVQTGSFEQAAHRLHVTPSAISQRVKGLEERLGTVLITRGSPCVATETGAWLCRHMEQIGLLEHELFQALPLLAERGDAPPEITIPIATTADSLGSWFLPAVAEVSRSSSILFNITIDDQDHTADWLRQGRVVAAVTSLETPVAGCRRLALGALRYHATASPDFIARYCPDGITPQALARAPSLTFNHKDRLQDEWLESTFGLPIAHPTHWVPSTPAFVEACLAGMGWGMNPHLLADKHISQGDLVELVPGTALDIPLYWQISRLASPPLAGLTQAVLRAAQHSLRPLPAFATEPASP